MLSSVRESILKSLLVCVLLIINVPAFAKNTILVVGDSLSAGYGLQAGEGWVPLLITKLKQDKISAVVINSSVSGDTTSNGLMRLKRVLKQYNPTITIIELGGNDGLRGLQLAVIKRNLQQMINLVKSSGSQVLLLGVRLPPNYGKSYVDQFEAIYTRLAAENEIAVVPNMLLGIDDQADLISSDGIHPVSKAQPLILNNIWPILQPLIQSKNQSKVA